MTEQSEKPLDPIAVELAALRLMMRDESDAASDAVIARLSGMADAVIAGFQPLAKSPAALKAVRESAIGLIADFRWRAFMARWRAEVFGEASHSAASRSPSAGAAFSAKADEGAAALQDREG
jgi:hypothetical protein